MKKILLITVLIVSATALRAQFVYDYLKAADGYFAKEDFASAAEYFEKYFDDSSSLKKEEYNPYSPQNSAKKKDVSGSSKVLALYRLAESYRMLNYPAKAAPNYRKVIEQGGNSFPLAQYYYAIQLRALGNYAEAEQNFSSFLVNYKTNDEYRKDADRELKNLQYIQAQLKKKEIKNYSVHKAPGGLNTTGGSYAPVWLGANTLMFTSTRPLDSTAKSLKYSNRVFQAVYDGFNVGEITKTNLPQDPDIQQGVVSATPDGNILFLTRWSIKDKTKEATLYSSHRTSDGWSDPEKLDAAINVPGFNTQQPFVSPDGKYLLFSSNRNGGQGGYDLWYAPLENGKPGIPMNMGKIINTDYDEQAPSYHEASSSLIFSSNGRIGMGGYDFFQSKGSIGNWTEPVNLGYPVNSIKDDIYFSSKGPARNILENVILSSDRDAACCLELFSLKKIRPMRQVSGRIVSCDPLIPLKAATITIIDTINNKTILTTSVGATGNYSFTLEEHQPLKVTANATGFYTNSKQMNIPADPEAESFVYPDLCLVPEPPKIDEKFIIENVYYDFDKADLKPESFPALDELVRMLNIYPAMVIELGSHTDSKGSDSYNLILSEARAKSVVDYLVSKGIDPERLVSKGYGETTPIEPNTIDGNDNPEGREKNRRTEFKVLRND